MKAIVGIGTALVLAACTPPSGQKSNHQEWDFEYCKKIADETFEAGDINHNLCPGYMPDGQANEIP